ncbi:MAG: hypothetical protein HN736_02705 [Anaerolineae bacterium]|jgi:hypothetical protein|nr:hypothetical protein [Anaerolineae bacterium]MBT4312620.1 hypothetical protein [Anaerolineae bacterium]MBT4459797.1 hypothetical protein [Anaerolineae bacterium]MBT6059704.1 hypothetical protein [Anaerolineae bacterium]MBT6323274.1 hypothetical protein [Anaerolineae bacterium]
MKYTTEFDGTTQICIVRVSGELHSPKDSYKLQEVVIELQAKHESNIFLLDLVQAKKYKPKGNFQK